MNISAVQARQLVLKMLKGSIQLSGIAGLRDARNTKINLLKQWKKLLREIERADGQADAEAEKLTVGFLAAEQPDTYIFELRPKQLGGAISPRLYELIENFKENPNGK